MHWAFTIYRSICRTYFFTDCCLTLFQPGKDGVMLPALCFLRIIFLPLFAFCNALPRRNAPVFFDADYFPIVFMMLFAISNGYLGNLCMMYGPS